MTASDDPQIRAVHAAGKSEVALGEGDFRLALETALAAIDECFRGASKLPDEAIRLAFPNAVDAAMAIRDFDQAERLVELLGSRPQGEIAPFLRAQLRRASALLEAARGDDEGVEEGLFAAAEEFHLRGYPFWTSPSPTRSGRVASRPGQARRVSEARERRCRHVRDGRGRTDARSCAGPSRA